MRGLARGPVNIFLDLCREYPVVDSLFHPYMVGGGHIRSQTGCPFLAEVSRSRCSPENRSFSVKFFLVYLVVLGGYDFTSESVLPGGQGFRFISGWSC